MSSYLRNFGTRTTPQSEPMRNDQVANSAGGFVWAVDQWTRLRRFLILGSEGGSYYVSETDLTRHNAQAILECIQDDGKRTVSEIVAVSQGGRAVKNDPAIFALALAASKGDVETRRAALDALPLVCRTGTMLFTFAALVEMHRGWGRALRRAVSQWYGRELEQVAYQVVKYRQRNGWTHRDLLRLAHPKAEDDEHDMLFSWITGKKREDEGFYLPEIVTAFEAAQASSDAATTAKLILQYPNLPREAIKPEHLGKEVWEALLAQDMPMTALIRNLPSMTRAGVLDAFSDGTKAVLGQLADTERLRKARVHPLAILLAMKTYASGVSLRGSSTWTPVASIIDALDAAFYGAFGNVTPTNKRMLLGLDVSGSMSWGNIGGLPSMTPREVAAALALVTAAVEPSYMIHGFAGGFVNLPITPRQRLNDVMALTSSLGMDRTDCAVPMWYALDNRLEIDTFVIYTDNETWAGTRGHPAEALRLYRERSGIPAKLVTCAMTSSGFTIADPNDVGMLDIVGCDTSTPSVISEFSTDSLPLS